MNTYPIYFCLCSIHSECLTQMNVESCYCKCFLFCFNLPSMYCIINLIEKKIPANLRGTDSINSVDKKLRCKIDCYIHIISSVIISLLLLLVAFSIGCSYYFTSHRSKQKSVLLY